MKILDQWEKQPREYHFAMSILFTLVIGFLDYWMGFAYRMNIFYLIPISYSSWFIGKKTGMAFSILPVITLLYSAMESRKNSGNFPIEIWNLATYLVFFIVVALLLSQLRTTMRQRAGLMTKLENALSAVEELSGILPICANCKKIRDDEGYWHDVEVYISRHTKVEFTHGICRECANKLYPSLFEKIEKRGTK